MVKPQRISAYRAVCDVSIFDLLSSVAWLNKRDNKRLFVYYNEAKNKEDGVMKIDLNFFISVVSVLLMFYCFYLVVSLKQMIPGGMVGKRWNFLVLLVTFFTIGYLTTPFFSVIPENLLRLIVSLIFFFGAIYVIITVKLIYNVIKELTE